LLRGRPEALNRLLAYEWPGNVRELRNVFERATILCERGAIFVEDLALCPDSTAIAFGARQNWTTSAHQR